MIFFVALLPLNGWVGEERENEKNEGEKVKKKKKQGLKMKLFLFFPLFFPCAIPLSSMKKDKKKFDPTVI